MQKHTHVNGSLWDNVREEVRETQQEWEGPGEGGGGDTHHCLPSTELREEKKTLLPVSAAGCSESCCPVIRCRQTCWELWRLAWSMLQKHKEQRGRQKKQAEFSKGQVLLAALTLGQARLRKAKLS